MADFRPFGASNEPGTCVWCGKVLRRPHHVEKASTDSYTKPASECVCGARSWRLIDTGHGRQWECAKCGDEVAAYRAQKVVSRRPVYTKPGDYGDGHFCGLRCGYQFAVALADLGDRLKPRGAA